MRSVLLPNANSPDSVSLSSLHTDTPIFVIKDGELVGMLVNEPKGWIVRTGGPNGVSGYHPDRLECLRSAIKWGFSPVTP